MSSDAEEEDDEPQADPAEIAAKTKEAVGKVVPEGGALPLTADDEEEEEDED